MIRQRLDSPRSIGVIAGLLAILFVVARLLVAADGDVSQFVVAGNVHTDAAQVEPAIHVFETAGYDGQFYWRLATNPAELDPARYRGVAFDSPLRASRIGYPVIAWILSFGQAEWAKWSLVAANILGIAVLAASGATLARNRARSSIVGLVFASSSGLVMSLSRDLCEVTMVAALVAGLALMSRGHFASAAACWVLACLIHEQSLFLVIPYGAHRVFQMARNRKFTVAKPDAPWIAGLVGFGLWQLTGRLVLGSFPVLASGSASLDIPFKGFLEQANYWIRNGFEDQQFLVVPQLALLVVLVVLAARSTADLAPDDRWLRWALVTAAALATGLSQNVWVGPAELRHVVVLFAIAWLVLVASSRRLSPILIGATGAVWLATAVLRTAAI